MQLVGFTKLCYAMATDHELGMVRKIPMKTHLILDCIGGATLAALPYLVGEEDDIGKESLVGMGLFDIAAAPLTQTTPTRRSPVANARRTAVRKVERVARQTAGAIGGSSGR